MLFKLELSDSVNAKSAECGIIHSCTQVQGDADCIRKFTTSTIADHEFWIERDEKYKESQVMYSVYEKQPGIYWAWNLHNDLKHMFNVSSSESFPQFDLKRAQFYTSKEFSEIFNLDRDIDTLSTGKPRPMFYDLTSSYGVADNIEQVLERYKPIIDSIDINVVISIAPIKKSEQPEDGGWRWHKCGEYIGTHTPTHEYLYDEPGIEEVLCFSIFVVNF